MDRRRVLSWKSWTRNGNNNIKVQELDDTPLQGTFYACNLQKVHVAEATYFRVEKVLKRQKDKLFVKWKGYPSKYNSWINKDLKWTVHL